MNATTTNLPVTDTKNSNTEKRPIFGMQTTVEKKKTMKSLSLRPSRSVKKNSSIKPAPLKRS
jgi:hypothetical protein